MRKTKAKVKAVKKATPARQRNRTTTVAKDEADYRFSQQSIRAAAPSPYQKS